MISSWRHDIFVASTPARALYQDNVGIPDMQNTASALAPTQAAWQSNIGLAEMQSTTSAAPRITPGIYRLFSGKVHHN